MSERFSVGVNYWPRRSAYEMWTRFDAGEIREDFAHVAALGLDTVRFFLRWDAFAPQPDSIDGAMLDRLETVMAAAHDAGLSAIPTLACGNAGGANFLPAWAIDPQSRASTRTIVDGAVVTHGARDLYRGPLLDAQRVLASAAGKRLRGHPALRAWDLGNAFADVRPPAPGKVPFGEHSSAPVSEAEVAAWGRSLAADLKTASGAGATAGATSEDLLRDRDVRLASLCAPFAFASMQGSNVTSPFARGRLDVEAIPFLAMLAASFSHKPVLVCSFGNPTCPGDKFSAFERFATSDEVPNPLISPDDSAFATFPCLTEAENAVWCAGVLERLHADGRLGALWSAWSDYGDEWANVAPFDLAPHERTCGIVRCDGSEKPVARALATFAREKREVRAERRMPMIAPVYYYRTLPKSVGTLYDAFLQFVKTRA